MLSPCLSTVQFLRRNSMLWSYSAKSAENASTRLQRSVEKPSRLSLVRKAYFRRSIEPTITLKSFQREKRCFSSWWKKTVLMKTILTSFSTCWKSAMNISQSHSLPLCRELDTRILKIKGDTFSRESNSCRELLVLMKKLLTSSKPSWYLLLPVRQRPIWKHSTA